MTDEKLTEILRSLTVALTNMATAIACDDNNPSQRYDAIGIAKLHLKNVLKELDQQ